MWQLREAAEAEAEAGLERQKDVLGLDDGDSGCLGRCLRSRADQEASAARSRTLELDKVKL